MLIAPKRLNLTSMFPGTVDTSVGGDMHSHDRLPVITVIIIIIIINEKNTFRLRGCSEGV